DRMIGARRVRCPRCWILDWFRHGGIPLNRLCSSGPRPAVRGEAVTRCMESKKRAPQRVDIFNVTRYALFGKSLQRDWHTGGRKAIFSRAFPALSLRMPGARAGT